MQPAHPRKYKFRHPRPVLAMRPQRFSPIGNETVGRNCSYGVRDALKLQVVDRHTFGLHEIGFRRVAG